MKPRIKLATSRTPDGGVMELFKHDQDFLIEINGQELMNSRRHESEAELARLGCAHLSHRKTPRVLVGGLGLGYTLRQVLDLLGPGAEVLVSELMPAVVEWNRTWLGELTAQPLEDRRTTLISGDIFPLLKQSRDRFDGILLDVDNGPRAITDSSNSRLYGPDGILACRTALRRKGVLSVWSAEPSKDFEQLLMTCGFKVRRYRANSYPGSSKKALYIFVAALDGTILPAGGGDAYQPGQRRPSHPVQPPNKGIPE